MAYTKSVARQEFEQTISMFNCQIKFASLKKNAIPHDIQQCVYRNAIFQSSAAVEEFVKSILEDWVHLLHVHNKTVSSIPRELMVWAVAKCQKATFQNFIASGDENKLIKQLSDNCKLFSIFEVDAYIKDIIGLSEHISDRKYPSEKNIIVLFKRFGINDLFKSIQIEGKKDYKRILKSFSDVRTEIAHEHPAPDLTSLDVKEQLTEICDFIAKIDMVMYSHVVAISGRVCWKTSRF
ncbi:HEPN domain-containing protein [Endozoicomonas sp. YOMI1]|uniref:HEPN domain-containing protein n=1 Tax=Endozoicomonas sp. YOMI1 TaxID=2828739 RepID=UPI0021475346